MLAQNHQNAVFGFFGLVGVPEHAEVFHGQTVRPVGFQLCQQFAEAAGGNLAVQVEDGLQGMLLLRQTLHDIGKNAAHIHLRCVVPEGAPVPLPILSNIRT